MSLSHICQVLGLISPLAFDWSLRSASCLEESLLRTDRGLDQTDQNNGEGERQVYLQTFLTAELLQEMAATQKLVPTGPIDIVDGLMEPLLTIEEGMQFVGVDGLECCCFNHRYPDGSYFKMWIKCKCRDGVGYFLVAPCRKWLMLHSLKPGTCLLLQGEADIAIKFGFSGA